MALLTLHVDINYAEDKIKIGDFFKEFIPKAPRLEDEFEDFGFGDDDAEGMDEGGAGDSNPFRGKYMKQLKRIAQREQSTIYIELEDIREWQKSDVDLVDRIRKNARTYVNLFSDVVDSLIPAPEGDLSHKDDVLDTLLHHRLLRNEQIGESGQPGFPPKLLRRYELFFKPLDSDTTLAVREVRGAHLGKLITARGIVTRVSEVKPLLLVNCYTCDSCGSEVYQDIVNKQFTPIVDCPTEECKKNSRRGTLHMQTRASKFRPFQEVKFQEMADQVPVGHIPRSMTAHVYGPLARVMNPGDVVQVSGIFLPTPYTGFQAIRAGLLTDSYLEAHHVHQIKKTYNEMKLTPEIEAQLVVLQSSGNIYEHLALSIAPEIFGHLDVKKALLLLLVGSATKSMGDGMKIRGDINVCLMGDPGVAKSQLLKYISKVAPRGVYTTGKGSSGVGLTAAVMRDPVTDEMVLEGGALVLADNGICCIDEFDKMEESDRTAIHEVMEQQTISISKAGITTTLNARTSILAAANPLYGRYNTKVSPVENINLPAALLSRFDIMFLILDKPSRESDEELARHVTHVHMFGRHPELEYEPVDPEIMRHYIAKARTFRPTVPPEVSRYVVDTYVMMRKKHQIQEKEKKSHTYTSARTLLGVIRLAQALARLHWSDTVRMSDVDEALRLMEASKESLLDDADRDRESDQSHASKIFRIIKNMALSNKSAGGARRSRRRLGKGPGGENDMDVDSDAEEGSSELSMVDIRARIMAQSFTETQLMETILEYEGLDVWVRVANGTKLRFVGDDDDE